MSTYPAPYQDINLNFLRKLQKIGNGLVGYSGHDQGITVALAAVTLGARVIEKHLTLDRSMDGPDHRASLEPDEFKLMVEQIRVVEQALGKEERYMSRGEYMNRQILSKSLVAASDLKKGHILSYADITVRSPGKGTNPLKIDHFIGKKLIQRNVKQDEYLLESDVVTRPQEFDDLRTKTKHRWGVVARMSDISSLLNCKSHFVEVHLTDSDIIQHKLSRRKIDRDLVVHGPEYKEDLLLDLSSLNEEIRSKSVDFFNQALSYARKLKLLFNHSNRLTKFVIHPGGFSMSRPLFDQADDLYSQLEKSLGEIDFSGFDPLVENMPGLPWFFGGQWYGSIFMDSAEIVDFSKRTGYGIVFDTSHAGLYCNLYHQDLYDYAQKIKPVTKYIHIADASGSNGEGLQIGDGSINFEKLLNILLPTDLWFLPEVWQGHKFNGEGFLRAIHRLKKYHSLF